MMAEGRMAYALTQQADGGEFHHSLVEAVLQLLVEADVDGSIGANRHGRSAESAAVTATGPQP